MSEAVTSAHSADGESAHPVSAEATKQKTEENAHGNGSAQQKWIWVLDPLTRKLRVPIHLLSPTQATAVSGTVPSLCIGFLEGRCRHQWCRQAHVFPEAIQQLRHEALHAPTCCKDHCDPHSIESLTKDYTHIRIVYGSHPHPSQGVSSGAIQSTPRSPGNGQRPNREGSEGEAEEEDDDKEWDLIPATRVASTVGLLRYLVQYANTAKSNGEKKKAANVNSEAANVQAAQDGPAAETSEAAGSKVKPEKRIMELHSKWICRLHLYHHCRYLEDCNNIHICREYESRVPPPPSSLAVMLNITQMTKEVTIGDARYEVIPKALGGVSDEDFQAIVDMEKEECQAQKAAAAHDPLGSTGVDYADSPLGDNNFMIQSAESTPRSVGRERGGGAPLPSFSLHGVSNASAAGAHRISASDPLRSVASTAGSERGLSPPPSFGPSIRVYDLLSKHCRRAIAGNMSLHHSASNHNASTHHHHGPSSASSLNSGRRVSPQFSPFTPPSAATALSGHPSRAGSGMNNSGSYHTMLPPPPPPPPVSSPPSLLNSGFRVTSGSGGSSLTSQPPAPPYAHSSSSSGAVAVMLNGAQVQNPPLCLAAAVSGASNTAGSALLGAGSPISGEGSAPAASSPWRSPQMSSVFHMDPTMRSATTMP